MIIDKHSILSASYEQLEKMRDEMRDELYSRPYPVTDDELYLYDMIEKRFKALDDSLDIMLKTNVLDDIRKDYLYG